MVGAGDDGARRRCRARARATDGEGAGDGDSGRGRRPGLWAALGQPGGVDVLGVIGGNYEGNVKFS